jgi:cell division cycle protein 37
MISGDRRAIDVFVNDAEGTYTHLLQRAAAANAEDAAGGGGGAEQIQLVPQGEGQTISFNVPDGPPPVDLRLEGEGTENLDLEEVRKALQMRWDIFSAFDADMQEALRSNELDEVNKVLGAMSVERAEDVVQQLDMAGILNFAEGGIRDETPAGKAKTAEEVVE